MRRPCANMGENLGTIGRKTWAHLSPLMRTTLSTTYLQCEQPTYFPQVVHYSPPALSPLKYRILPLIEQKFYPVSTAPIISTTNF
jgi:hypothetical protein